MKNDSRQQLEANLDRFTDATALYREGTRVSRVKMNRIILEDAGLRATVDLIPTRGLYNNRPAQWGIYSAWSVFGCSKDRWDAPYISLTIYFNPALIDAVVAFCATVEDESYNKHRYDEIGRCIRTYRQRSLADQLPATLNLFRNDTLIGTIADQKVSEHLEVSGNFISADINAELCDALTGYRHAWESTDDDALDSTLVNRLSGGWRLEGADGEQFTSRIPIIDFERRTIVWRWAGSD